MCVHEAGGGGGAARTDRSFQSLPQLFSLYFCLLAFPVAGTDSAPLKE